VAISTPDDFLKTAAEQRKKAGQELRLPSGLTVLAWQPSAEWWMLEVGRLPQTMAAKIVGAPVNGAGLTAESVVEFAKWTTRVLEAVVIEPKIRLRPGPGEVDPNVITDDDLGFLIRFAGGEVTPSGRDLDGFSGERRTPPESRDSGGPVALAP